MALFNKTAGFVDHYVNTIMGGYDPRKVDPEAEAKAAQATWIADFQKKYGTSTSDKDLFHQFIKQKEEVYKDARTAALERKKVGIEEINHMRDKFINEEYKAQARTEKMSDEEKLAARQAAAALAEQNKEHRLDKREAYKQTDAEFQQVKAVNDLIYKASNGNKEPIGQNDYDAIKQMAYKSGNDLVWKEDKTGVQYGDKKYVLSLEKTPIGFQDANQTVYFDRNGWKYKDTDGKWYMGKPEWYGGKEKTVTIEGKQYKDGDIITQGGKQFRVKI
jgi:hypothetical protein